VDASLRGYMWITPCGLPLQNTIELLSTDSFRIYSFSLTFISPVCNSLSKLFRKDFMHYCIFGLLKSPQPNQISHELLIYRLWQILIFAFHPEQIIHECDIFLSQNEKSSELSGCDFQSFVFK
jgi:hypothetical protein